MDSESMLTSSLPKIMPQLQHITVQHSVDVDFWSQNDTRG